MSMVPASCTIPMSRPPARAEIWYGYRTAPYTLQSDDAAEGDYSLYQTKTATNQALAAGSLDFAGADGDSWAVNMWAKPYSTTGGSHSTEEWLRLMAITSSTDGTTRVNVDYHDDETGVGSGRLRAGIYIKSGGWMNFESTAVGLVSPDAWTHVAVISDNGLISLYVNGVKMMCELTADDRTDNGPIGTIKDEFVYTKTMPSVASYYGMYYNNSWKGRLDDIVLSDAAELVMVPEPMTMALLMLGVPVLLNRRRS